jgi:hypothetical protein
MKFHHPEDSARRASREKFPSVGAKIKMPAVVPEPQDESKDRSCNS